MGIEAGTNFLPKEKSTFVPWKGKLLQKERDFAVWKSVLLVAVLESEKEQIN